MLKIIFISISTLLIFTISTGKFFIFNCKNSKYLTQCGMVMVVLFGLYSVCAILLSLFTPVLSYKICLFLLAFSPYLIGRLTTYKTLNISTVMQLFVLLTGIFYVVQN